MTDQYGSVLKLDVTKGFSNQQGYFNIRPALLVCLFLVVATSAVYGKVSHHSFVDYDDPYYITANPRVQAGLTAEGVVWAFTTTHALNWQPMTWLSHMLDFQLYGANPAAHHLTNLLLHIFNTWLLFLVLRRMSGDLWRSGFVAALFALHPLHVESVAWVAERKDVLSTFFWMLALWGYARYAKRPGFFRYLPVLLFFALGLMAKPMVVTLPFVLLLLDYWPLGRFQSSQVKGVSGSLQQKPATSSLIWEKLPLLVLAVTSGIVTLLAQRSGGAVASLISYPLSCRIANALVSYVGYIGKMIWPVNLAVYYPHPGMPPWWQVTGGGLLIAAILALAIHRAGRHPWFLAGWLWYMGTLVPVIGLIQVGSQAMADRYAYIPLIGLYIIFAWGGHEILARWRVKSTVVAAGAGAVVVALMAATWIQVGYWKNTVTLFEHTLDATTGNYLAHNNLGVALSKLGRTEQAIKHYAEALRLLPTYEEAQFNMGFALYSQGKVEAAVDHYTRALQLDPGYKEAHNNLALALVAQGKTGEGIRHYFEALAIDPDFKLAHTNLAGVLLVEGRVEESIHHYSEALRIDPNDSWVHRNMENAETRLHR